MRRHRTLPSGRLAAVAAIIVLTATACWVGEEVYAGSTPIGALRADSASAPAFSRAPEHAYGALVIAPSLQGTGRPAASFVTAATRDGAINGAAASCSRHAHDCKTLVWVENGYAAVVYEPVKDGAFGYGWGTSRAQAVSKAAQRCSVSVDGGNCLRPPIAGHIVTGGTPSPDRHAVGGTPATTQIYVPFTTQNGTGFNNCGPAVITMAIRYFHGSATVEETAGAMRGKLINSKKGTLTLRPGPRSAEGHRGYTNVTGQTTQWWLSHHVAGLGEQPVSTFGQIKSEIDRQRPVIVLVWMHGGNHYIVITGYDARDVYINDPYNYAPSKVPIAALAVAEAKVKGGGYQAVAIGYFAHNGLSPLLDVSLAITWLPLFTLWIYLLFQAILRRTAARTRRFVRAGWALCRGGVATLRR